MKRTQRLLIIIYCLITLSPVLAQEAPEATFGKTHFIVGYTEDKKTVQPEQKIIEKQPSPYNLICDNCVKSAYFSPDDDVRSVLLYLIAQETKSIRIAMFTFTEKKLAQALVNAQQRGVRVEIVIDQSNLYNRYSKLSSLYQGKVKLFVYHGNCIQKNISGLMHNKFILFEKNILGKSLVCTGSFNFTRAAHRSNQENVLVLDDNLFVTKYGKKFEQLKNCSDHYQEKNPVKRTKKT